MPTALNMEIIGLLTAFPILSGIVGKFLIDVYMNKSEKLKKLESKLHNQEIDHTAQVIKTSLDQITKDVDGLGGSFRRHKSAMTSQINEHEKAIVSATIEIRMAVKEMEKLVIKVENLEERINQKIAGVLV